MMRLDHPGLHDYLVLVRQENWHKAEVYWSPKGVAAWPGAGWRITKH